MKLFKFWPGFLPFYQHGSFTGWLLAMFFAWFAIAVVTGTLFWSEWIPAASHKTLWLMLGIAWVLGILISSQMESSLRQAEEKRARAATAEDTLPLAQTAYLRSEFYEAERILRERLAKFPEDVPARLLLASTLRQQNRKNDALAQLTQLETNSTVGSWLFEVHREKELLKG